MKQYITLKQWDELDGSEQVAFIGGINVKEFPNIGQMIEFLGDDLISIDYDYSPRDVDVTLSGKRVKHDNLCDALWEAVKYKLNETKQD